jgi:uncharacterized hydrophobic protein (TIGR00271 family)
MSLLVFHTLSEQEKSNAVEKLIEQSTPRQDFFVLVVLSILMATFGLLLDSAAVVIGSMLIAPMLYPILGVSLGVIMSDARLMRRSFVTVVKSIALAVIASASVALLARPLGYVVTPEILARTQPSMIYAAVAVVAGLAASLALVKEKLVETLPGIAISVALIPPLSVIGIGLAWLDFGIATRAFLLFFLNAVGIVFASMVVFSLMNFYVKRAVADAAITREDAEVVLEEARARVAQQKE